ncbi:hypothetical protein DERP_003939 [Dermatophagoides pteronyssinus]|uniref:Uncharacterized protein n=1 Tax=Dermatophagoides pteronyssinus TaxID=6956 RepID=A0ABQ8J7S5_DERPT|nr:hypothetical protein DERP_003939 [Dermatophagoides pteronyssinus]
MVIKLQTPSSVEKRVEKKISKEHFINRVTKKGERTKRKKLKIKKLIGDYGTYGLIQYSKSSSLVTTLLSFRK